MGIAVEIVQNDDGTFSVGQCEPDSENLQPVEGGLKEALMQAAEMLKGSDNGDNESAEGQQEAFESGYKSVNGGASVTQ